MKARRIYVIHIIKVQVLAEKRKALAMSFAPEWIPLPIGKGIRSGAKDFARACLLSAHTCTLMMCVT